MDAQRPDLRVRIEALPNARRSLRVAAVWGGLLLLIVIGLLLPEPLDAISAVAGLAFVWVCADADFIRLVVTVTGGKLGSERWMWVLFAMRAMVVALMLFFAIVLLRIFL